MTYDAYGETKNAMARSLKIEGMSHSESQPREPRHVEGAERLRPEDRSGHRQFAVGARRRAIQREFLASNWASTAPEISTLDFGSPQSVATINRWVSDNTNGKISQIIDKIDPQKVICS